MGIPGQRSKLEGQRFERLLVLSFEGIGKRGHAQFLCRCDCGNEKVVPGTSLLTGNTRSCGCIFKEHARTLGFKHGKTATPEWGVWSKMISRCTRPADNAFVHYGGRGIVVCERWKDFANFLADMGQRPSRKHSIDRIEVNGNYCPENCRWATPLVQMNNTTRNRRIVVDGKSMTMSEAARRYNIQPATLRNRLVNLRWSPDRAVKVSPEEWKADRSRNGGKFAVGADRQ